MKGLDQLVLTEPEVPSSHEPTVVPCLRDIPASIATARASAEGFRVSCTATTVGDAGRAGLVVAQAPAEDDVAARGSVITLEIGTPASCPEPPAPAHPSERESDALTVPLEEWLTEAALDTTAAPYVVDLASAPPEPSLRNEPAAAAPDAARSTASDWRKRGAVAGALIAVIGAGWVLAPANQRGRVPRAVQPVTAAPAAVVPTAHPNRARTRYVRRERAGNRSAARPARSRQTLTRRFEPPPPERAPIVRRPAPAARPPSTEFFG